MHYVEMSSNIFNLILLQWEVIKGLVFQDLLVDYP